MLDAGDSVFPCRVSGLLEQKNAPDFGGRAAVLADVHLISFCGCLDVLALCQGPKAGDFRRVCRAWHRANRVQVPVPGVRGAEG